MLPRGFQEHPANPRVNEGGRRRRGSLPPSASTAVADFAPPSTGRGRRRGAKRSLVYAGLAAYNAHFASLVAMELKHEKVPRFSPSIFLFFFSGGFLCVQPPPPVGPILLFHGLRVLLAASKNLAPFCGQPSRPCSLASLPLFRNRAPSSLRSTPRDHGATTNPTQPATPEPKHRPRRTSG